jgi:hypothetical protein
LRTFSGSDKQLFEAWDNLQVERFENVFVFGVGLKSKKRLIEPLRTLDRWARKLWNIRFWLRQLTGFG